LIQISICHKLSTTEEKEENKNELLFDKIINCFEKNKKNRVLQHPKNHKSFNSSNVSKPKDKQTTTLDVLTFSAPSRTEIIIKIGRIKK
jgi:hypothetical protein